MHGPMGEPMPSFRFHASCAALVLAACLATDRAVGAENEVETLRSELAATRSELDETRATLAQTIALVEDLSRKVDDVASREPARVEAREPATDETARLPPVDANNPAISFVVDAKARSDTHGDDGVGFLLGSAELFISAPIDPYLRGYVSINATSDESFDVEEAALVTTALPLNLTVKAGRLFADVGRFPHWHDEALPFAERPASIDRIFGGETSAEGVEASWLAPIDQFVQLTAGVYNSIGELPDGFESFVGQPSYSELTYLLRPHTYFDLSDVLNLELGGSYVAAPSGTRRRLYGVDLALRHQPGSSSFYQGAVLGSEWYWNDQEFLDGAGGSERFHRDGGYAYLEGFFGRSFSGGLLFDHAEDIADEAARQNTYAGFVTWKPSEFQRLRLQLGEIDQSGPNDLRVWLQWTAFIGSHSHGFANR